MDTFYETQPQLSVGKSAHLPTGHAQEPVLKMPCGYSYILTHNRTSKKIKKKLEVTSLTNRILSTNGIHC